MKNYYRIIVVLLGILLILGCSNEGGEKKTETTKGDDSVSEEKVKLKVAYMPNFASLWAVVAGIETGSFAEEGVEVELIEFADGPTIIAAMESGSIDVGYIGPGAHVLPIQGRADIFAFSQLGNADEVIGNAEKGVNSLEDLKGKTIAVAGGTSSETILKLTLKEAGLTEADVKLVDMDASAIVTAMISGGIDAAATWSPNTNAIKDEMGDHAVMISNNARYADEFPSIASWVTNPGYSEKNPGVLEKFTKGLFKAMDYGVENIDEVAQWVAKEIAVDPASVLAQTGDGDWISSKKLLEMIEDGTLEALYETQQENFVVEGRLTEADLVPARDYVLFEHMKNAAK